MSYLFVLCQAGAEQALKPEFARLHPEFRFAFSRPGFVTFKRDEAVPADFETPSVFARQWGVSLGHFAPDAAGLEKFISIFRDLQAKHGNLRLHFTERERFAPGEEPKNYVFGELVRPARSAAEAALLKAGLSALPGEKALPGDVVVDWVQVDEADAWVGYHQHSERRTVLQCYPGAKMPIVLPESSPSRAYLKIEEAIAWSGAKVTSGQVAVEVGAAPGGVLYAFLQRGVSVIGIDSAELDPAVYRLVTSQKNRDSKLADLYCLHLRRPVGEVIRSDLPPRVDWLCLDMNANPDISLMSVERVWHDLSSTLKGVFLTLKLNQWELSEDIPGYLKRIERMGLKKVRATQLPSNRREIMVFGENFV
jgi:23S rRNA (cytidine2498-2'-O)-methyltransferase